METGGPNRGPALDKLEAKFDMSGQSWCAIWAWNGFELAAEELGQPNECPKTASSQEMLEWFRDRGLVSATAEALHDWGGALAIRTDPGGLHGHVAPVLGRLLDANGKIAQIQTCEGNSDKNGGSNGDGAYFHVRSIPLPGVWHFCDVSNFAGGRWWL